MNYNAKKSKLNGIVYVILALAASMIMCVTIFSTLAAKRNEKSNIKNQSAALDNQSINESTPKSNDVNTVPSANEKSDAPVAKIEDNSLIVSATPEDEIPVFTMPYDGAIINNCSLDVLVYSLTMEDYRIHTGIDIELPDKSEIKASSEGIIESIYNDALWGYCVSICHPDGFSSVYKGLSDAFPNGINVGAHVNAGDVIGLSGDTAVCETALPSHLHFEILKDGAFVNPAEYLDAQISSEN